MSEVKIKYEAPVYAKNKKIRIKCPDGRSWNTKIYLNGEDLLKMLPGIRGIEFEDFVDDVIKLKLHLVAPPTEFVGEAKIIEIFGEKNYCLVDAGYIDELKAKIKK